jgi:hypothetical protein
MIDYKTIWDSINKESEASPQRLQIAREIPSLAIPVFLATDFTKKMRLLYINIDSPFSIQVDKLPKFKGLEINIYKMSLGQFVNQPFLCLSQTMPQTDRIFESFVSDICNKIVAVTDKKVLQNTLISSLNEWEFFFMRTNDDILSESNQKGLYGELSFLKDYLFKKYSLKEAISFWTGSDKSNHDFQLIGKAVEVKTTSIKQHKKFSISSEKQLDNTGLDTLILALFTVNVHENMPNKTLVSLITEIIDLLKNDPFLMYDFEIKLAKYGYDARFSEKYIVGFNVINTLFFDVKEGFPRILQSNVPNGVGDLKYSVVVAACMPFEIQIDIFKIL